MDRPNFRRLRKRASEGAGEGESDDGVEDADPR
jgi:hypothetical protein